MATPLPSRADLQRELADVRARLDEAEDALRALRTGEVDALVADGPHGPQIYTLEGADHSYRIIIEQMTEGAATVTSDGTVLYCNRRFATLIGRPIEEVIGASLARYLCSADLDALSVVSQGQDGGGLRRETVVTRADGASVPVFLSLNGLSAYDVSAACMMVTDLTEEKRNQRILASARLTSAVIEQAGEAIIVVGPEGTVIRANTAAQRLCDLDPLHEPFGAAFPMRLTRASTGGAGRRVTAAMLRSEPMSGADVLLDLPNGQRSELVLNSNPLTDDDDAVIGSVLTLTDVTHLKLIQAELARHRDRLQEMVAEATSELQVANTQLEAEVEERSAAEEELRTFQDQLRSLASQLLESEETERRRIAVGIHDDISQMLAVTKMKLQMLRQAAPSDESVCQFDELIELIGRLIGSTRDLTFDLSPPVLFELGLGPAMEWLADRLERQHGLCTEIIAHGPPKPLAHNTAIVVFRATRELLMNVMKHSGTSAARVEISREGNLVRVVVSDRGRGFTPSTAPRPEREGGFGLFSIRERMAYIGGTVNVASALRKGTTVTLTAPVDGSR
jgi:PAS domain S-box-containing protein